MAVIVNELEVVVGPAGAAAESAAPAAREAAPAGEPALSPADLADLLRHCAQRQARVWAH